jgi:hypothetical protein
LSFESTCGQPPLTSSATLLAGGKSSWITDGILEDRSTRQGPAVSAVRRRGKSDSYCRREGCPHPDPARRAKMVSLIERNQVELVEIGWLNDGLSFGANRLCVTYDDS